MRIRSVVLAILCLLGIIFLALNWTAIKSVVPVNLFGYQTEAPLGLMLLMILGVLFLTCLVWSLMQQAAALMDIRHAYKEAQVNKQLADNAEVSRTDALQKAISLELESLDKKLAERFETLSLTQSKQMGAAMQELAEFKTELSKTNANVGLIARKMDVELPEAEEEKPVGFFSRFKRKSKETKEQKELPSEAKESAES